MTEILKTVIMLVLMLMQVGCASGGKYHRQGVFNYSFKGMKGIVIDQNTGEPIKGACVVFEWNKKIANIAGGYTDGIAEIKEAVTDSNGYFGLDSWKSEISLNPHAYIDYPNVTIFKPGYKVWGECACQKEKPTKAGRVIFKLEKHDGSLDERLKALYWAENMMPDDLINIKKNHLDLKIPYMLEILREEEKVTDGELKMKKREEKKRLNKNDKENVGR